MSIKVFRGDTFKFNFNSALEDGTPYKFQPGDLIKVGIKTRLSNPRCAVLKTITIEEETDLIKVIFPHEETKKWCEGDKILEVELTDTQGNVYTVLQEKMTIVGDVINE